MRKRFTPGIECDRVDKQEEDKFDIYHRYSLRYLLDSLWVTRVALLTLNDLANFRTLCQWQLNGVRALHQLRWCGDDWLRSLRFALLYFRKCVKCYSPFRYCNWTPHCIHYSNTSCGAIYNIYRQETNDSKMMIFFSLHFMDWTLWENPLWEK